jgi:hypothetical protein
MVTLSQKEFQRVKVIENAAGGFITGSSRFCANGNTRNKAAGRAACCGAIWER